MPALLDGPEMMVSRRALPLLGPAGGHGHGAAARVVRELLVAGRADDDALLVVLGLRARVAREALPRGRDRRHLLSGARRRLMMLVVVVMSVRVVSRPRAAVRRRSGGRGKLAVEHLGAEKVGEGTSEAAGKGRGEAKVAVAAHELQVDEVVVLIEAVLGRQHGALAVAVTASVGPMQRGRRKVVVTAGVVVVVVAGEVDEAGLRGEHNALAPGEARRG